MPTESQIPTKIQRYVPAGQNFIAHIKRHFIGLLYTYLVILAGVAAIVMIAAVTVTGLVENIGNKDLTMLSFLGVLLAVLVVFVLILVTEIYFHNSLIITDQENIQLLQRGVFQVKVSHLSHADVEDVTSEQNGLLATIFNYGTLKIETSGEMRNFDFKYCPDPEKYARIVLEARQKFAGAGGSS